MVCAVSDIFSILHIWCFYWILGIIFILTDTYNLIMTFSSNNMLPNSAFLEICPREEVGFENFTSLQISTIWK
jgi:hypothetical protein